MQCEILKAFPFSRDGITQERADVGSDADIPDDLVPGLRDAGFISTKDAGASPENKMQPPPAENKADIADVRAEYERVVGKRPFHGWDAETLKAKIAEHDDSL